MPLRRIEPGITTSLGDLTSAQQPLRQLSYLLLKSRIFIYLQTQLIFSGPKKMKFGWGLCGSYAVQAQGRPCYLFFYIIYFYNVDIYAVIGEIKNHMYWKTSNWGLCQANICYLLWALRECLHKLSAKTAKPATPAKICHRI